MYVSIMILQRIVYLILKIFLYDLNVITDFIFLLSTSSEPLDFIYLSNVLPTIYICFISMFCREKI